MKKVYIFRNVLKGWGVIADSRHINTSNAIFFQELEQAQKFCNNNKYEVIRVCR